MNSRESLKLRKYEYYNHYVLSISLLVPVFILICYLIKDLILNEGNPIIEINGILIVIVIVIFIIGSILTFIDSKKKLNFQKYKVEMTGEEFKRAVKITSKELNWSITTVSDDYAEVYRCQEILGSRTEKITIKRTGKNLYINSIDDPTNYKKSLTNKRNKENVNSFLVNTANILKGKNVEEILVKNQELEEKKFWESNEWTLKGTLTRLIGYGLLALLMTIGMILVLEDIEGGFIVCIIIGGLGYIYIKSDIEILLEKRRRNRTK